MARSKILWHRFTLEQYLDDCRRFLASNWFAFEQVKNEGKDVLVIANFPNSLNQRLQLVKNIAQLEIELKQFLTSQDDQVDRRKEQIEKRLLNKLRSNLQAIYMDRAFLTEDTPSLSPLVSSFKKAMTQEFDEKSGFAWREAITQQQTHATPMIKKKHEKTDLDISRDKRIRKCNKRQANLYKKLKQVSKEYEELVIIDLAFATQLPFKCAFESQSTSVKKEGNSSRSTHFVNKFLALRSAKQYRTTVFKGLKGYVRKLEMVDSNHAIGGYITLIYNQKDMHQAPFETGRLLAKLLAEMSPDKPKEKGIKYPTYVFSCSHIEQLKPKLPKKPQAEQQEDILRKLIAKMNVYTHSEYFFDPLKVTIDSKQAKDGALAVEKNELNTDSSLSPTRSFSAGFSLQRKPK